MALVYILFVGTPGSPFTSILPKNRGERKKGILSYKNHLLVTVEPETAYDKALIVLSIASS